MFAECNECVLMIGNSLYNIVCIIALLIFEKYKCICHLELLKIYDPLNETSFNFLKSSAS